MAADLRSGEQTPLSRRVHGKLARLSSTPPRVESRAYSRQLAESTDRLRELAPPLDVVTCVGPEDRVLASDARARPSGELWFRQLYRTHFDAVIKLVLRFGIGRHDAEDIAQRVFLVAHRHIEDCEAIAHPGAWLRAITVRVVREHYRWLRLRRAANWLLELNWAGRVHEELTPEREALAGETLGHVRDVLLRMSEKLREALVLLDIEDLSPREAAELLRVPQNTLRSRRALAHKEFRRLWESAQRRKGTPHD